MRAVGDRTQEAVSERAWDKFFCPEYRNESFCSKDCMWGMQ